MRLQIVEYRIPNMLEGNIDFRYMLELEEKVVLWTPPTPTKKEPKKVYSILMSKMLDKSTDLNPKHWMKFMEFPGMDREVIFEKEVSDAYLKELYIERRMKDIEKDFI